MVLHDIYRLFQEYLCIWFYMVLHDIYRLGTLKNLPVLPPHWRGHSRLIIASLAAINTWWLLWAVHHPMPRWLILIINYCFHSSIDNSSVHRYRTETGIIMLLSLSLMYVKQIWDLDTEKVVHTLEVSGSESKTTCVACHPTLPILVTTLDDGTVCFWDAITYRWSMLPLFFYEHTLFHDSNMLVFANNNIIPWFKHAN